MFGRYKNHKLAILLLVAGLLLGGVIGYVNRPSCANKSGASSVNAAIQQLLDAAKEQRADRICRMVEEGTTEEEINVSLAALDQKIKEMGGYDAIEIGDVEQLGSGFDATVTASGDERSFIISAHSSARPFVLRYIQPPLGEQYAYYIGVPSEY